MSNHQHILYIPDGNDIDFDQYYHAPEGMTTEQARDALEERIKEIKARNPEDFYEDLYDEALGIGFVSVDFMRVEQSK